MTERTEAFTKRGAAEVEVRRVAGSCRDGV